MGRKSTIRSALPITYRSPGSTRDGPRDRWWLEDESLIPVVRDLVRIAATRPLSPDADVEVLKENDRKVVLRLVLSPQNGTGAGFIAKVHYLEALRRRMGYRRLCFDEAAATITATGRGVPAPRIAGCGLLATPFGLVSAGMLLQEDLSGCTTVSDLIRSRGRDGKSCADLLERTTPLFISLFEAGCNHIDANCDNILLAGGGGAAYLIDFQHAQFFDRPSAEVLMLEAGVFARSLTLRGLVSEDELRAWLDGLLVAAGVAGGDDKERLARRFDHYRAVSLSRRVRRRVR